METKIPVAESHSLIIGVWMESHSPATTRQIMDGTGLSEGQVSSGLQHFRRRTGPILGVSIVWDLRNGVFEYTDELGDYIQTDTIAGYEASLWKRLTSYAMTAYQLSRTAYKRAYIDDDTLAVAIYRKRARSFRDSLETFSAEAAMIGDVAEVERIEDFLLVNAETV